jgi:hypothetical protein
MKPLNGLGIVSRHASILYIREAESILGISVSLLSSKLIVEPFAKALRSGGGSCG